MRRSDDHSLFEIIPPSWIAAAVFFAVAIFAMVISLSVVSTTTTSPAPLPSALIMGQVSECGANLSGATPHAITITLRRYPSKAVVARYSITPSLAPTFYAFEAPPGSYVLTTNSPSSPAPDRIITITSNKPSSDVVVPIATTCQ